nr:hypothetical protein GCM10020063_001510 [Dactylosporangium thailandense]
MKIVKVATYRLPPRWLFLAVSTDEGITGWGEPVVEGRSETVQTAISELSDISTDADVRVQDAQVLRIHGRALRVSEAVAAFRAGHPTPDTGSLR